MKSTREAYGDALVSLGQSQNFYVVDADLSKATQTVHFSKAFPDRFFNLGIAEGNMMGFAAGLSSLGTPVFASSFASFASGRAYDQVRNTIAYSQCNVKIGATHAGIAVGPDGGSHQCIEDIALMRAIPGMVVLCPCDYDSATEYVKLALEYQGPVYLRFARSATPAVYTDSSQTFALGKGNLVKEGSGVTILAIGDMVSRAMTVAKESPHSIRVVDMASIKPIDQDMILRCARETGAIVTAEDHNMLGGLGGAVAEVLAQHCPCPQEFVAVPDVFGSSGSPSALAEAYGIDEKSIATAVEKVLTRKV